MINESRQTVIYHQIHSIMSWFCLILWQNDRVMKHQKITRAELMCSLTECKEQTGNSYIYTASCQYFPGLHNLTQLLGVCHDHCPFFFLSLAFVDVYVNFADTTSSWKSSK